MYKQRKVKKSLMFIKKKQCNKSSLAKEKECGKFDTTYTASLLNGLKI